MNDAEIVHRIGVLADEEHTLERSHEGEEFSEQELDRLREIEVTLDQCWDLLRQRRARREYGEDPTSAQSRPLNEVEGYLQ